MRLVTMRFSGSSSLEFLLIMFLKPFAGVGLYWLVESHLPVLETQFQYSLQLVAPF